MASGMLSLSDIEKLYREQMTKIGKADTERLVLAAKSAMWTPGTVPSPPANGDVWGPIEPPPLAGVMNEAGALPEPEPEIYAMNPETGRSEFTPYGQIMIRFARVNRAEINRRGFRSDERLPNIAHLSACIVGGRAHVFVVTRAGIARHIEDDFHLFPSDGLMVQLHAIAFNEDHDNPVLGGVATR
jgi:hypothetical protein